MFQKNQKWVYVLDQQSDILLFDLLYVHVDD